MKLTIGNPAGGICVEVEVGKDATKKEIDQDVRTACDALKVGVESWRAWSLKNETPEEKKAREMNEEHQSLQLQLKERQIVEMRTMLDGKGKTTPVL